jgi:heme exporter protein CcmD
MIDWLQDPRADYVLAAYGAALLALLGLLAVSLIAARRRQKELQHLPGRRVDFSA